MFQDKVIDCQRAIPGLRFVSLLLFCSPALAVKMEPDGHGQALIFPYIGVKAGNSSLISIGTPRAAALKVNFRDVTGELSLSLNVYTESNSTWVAALSRQVDNMQAAFPDAGCVLSEAGALTDGTSIDLESGYVEVVHMGNITDEEVLGFISEDRCDRLALRWDNSPWSNNPSNGLSYTGSATPPTAFGTLTIINVPRGAMFSVPVTGLSNFSNIVQHTAPGNPLPDLGSAHNEGTTGGATISTNCGFKGCQTDSWATPADAVAAALMTHELVGTFSIEESIGAKTEVVMTQPLTHVYQRTGAASDQLTTFFDLYIFDRAGDGYIVRRPCITGMRCGRAPYEFASNSSVVTFSFSTDIPGFQDTSPSDILGEPRQIFFPNNSFPLVPDSGSFTIDYKEPASFHSNKEIISLEGNNYLGSPSIAVSFTEVSNNTLTDGGTGQLVKANYGDAARLVRFFEGH